MGWLGRAWRALLGAPRAPKGSPSPEEEEEGEQAAGTDQVVVMPIEDAIDLHHFAPRDVPSVVREYVRAAHERGFREVTLIHGRGKGIQRAKVAQVLASDPRVASFRPASGARALGATIAVLEPRRRRR